MIHSASKSIPRPTKEHPDQRGGGVLRQTGGAGCRSNVRCTELVLDTARRHGLDPIVHVSSYAVFLPVRGATIGPDDPPGEAPWPYSRSKADSERDARARQHDGAPVVIVSPGMVWGPTRSPPRREGIAGAQHPARTASLRAAWRISHRRRPRCGGSHRRDVRDRSRTPSLHARRPELMGSIYRALLDLTASTVTIDVISCTSAGGINDAFLGLPIAYQGDLSKLAELWATEGSLDRLLRKPLQREPESLFRGDAYFLRSLNDAFTAVWRENMHRFVEVLLPGSVLNSTF